MPLQVISGATLQCSMGSSPSNLEVLPTNEVMATPPPAATIMDHIPMVNIMPFGMCSSLANPEVASATAAAEGVLTPMPCIPVVPAPWAPGDPTILIANMTTLNDPSTCTCTWAGIISITNAGQTSVETS